MDHSGLLMNVTPGSNPASRDIPCHSAVRTTVCVPWPAAKLVTQLERGSEGDRSSNGWGTKLNG